MNQATKSSVLYAVPDRAKLDQLRRKDGLTYQEVAALTDIPQGSLGKVFRKGAAGAVNMTHLKCIADLFGVEVSDIIKSPPKRPGPTLVIPTEVDGYKLANALAALDDVRDYLEGVTPSEGAAQRYRELVSVFSIKPLAHTEALAELRRIIDDAAKFRRIESALGTVLRSDA